MNIRRALLIAFAVFSVAPRAVLGQATKPPVVIGWLHLGSRESGLWQLTSLKEGLAALGYKEGQHYVIEERWAQGREERIQALAAELVAKKPVVIVPAFSIPARAAAKAAPTTPIVLVGGNPVEMGLVNSLARPGGMITGLSNVLSEVREKYIELLVAAAPTARRIGVLHRGNPGSAAVARSKDAAMRFAAQHGIEVRFEGVTHPEEIEPALSRLTKQGTQALVVFPHSMFGPQVTRIVKYAQGHRWPLVGSPALMRSEDGALISYGADVPAIFRRAAWYVDRILKGTKPGDLPIEQPMTFELVVNLKIAKVLGLTMPPEIMIQATRVIQ